MVALTGTPLSLLVEQVVTRIEARQKFEKQTGARMSDVMASTFTGRVVADGEEMKLGERAAISFRVAINGRKKQGDEWVDAPLFVRCKDFNVQRGARAVKGAKVNITGKTSWDERPADKGGGFYSPDITVWNMEVTNPPADGAPQKQKEIVREKAGSKAIPF